MGGNVTGHLEELPHDSWRLVVNLPAVVVNGERRHPRRTRIVQARGVKAARCVLSGWIAELEQYSCVDASRLAVAELLRRWLAAIDVRPKTRQFYADNVRLHVVPAIGDVLACDLRPSHLTALYAAKRDAGLSETTCRHVHATVRAALSWAVNEELVDRNAAERVQDPPRQARREVATWSQDVTAEAVRAAQGLRILTPLVLAVWAGLRAGEVCGLEWRDVDLDGAVLHVVRSLEQTRGGLYVVPPKSASGIRDVPMPRQLVDALRAERLVMDEAQVAHGGAWNPGRRVCCRQNGEPLPPNNLSSAWRRFCKRHDLPVIRFHDLRHSYATELFDQGGGDKEHMLKIVQERLGHAQPSTTAGIYLHVTKRASSAATEEQERRIDAALAKTAEKSHSSSTRVVSLDERRRQKSCK